MLRDFDGDNGIMINAFWKFTLKTCNKINAIVDIREHTSKK